MSIFLISEPGLVSNSAYWKDKTLKPRDNYFKPRVVSWKTTWKKLKNVITVSKPRVDIGIKPHVDSHKTTSLNHVVTAWKPREHFESFKPAEILVSRGLGVSVLNRPRGPGKTKTFLTSDVAHCIHFSLVGWPLTRFYTNTTRCGDKYLLDLLTSAINSCLLCISSWAALYFFSSAMPKLLRTISSVGASARLKYGDNG